MYGIANQTTGTLVLCYNKRTYTNKMNIFVVDRDPLQAAQMLPDRHVTKMILESAQMLSIVYSPHYWDIGEIMKVDGTPFKTAKGAFKNHPCTIWAAESQPNCAWLIQHAVGLCSEFKLRYGKLHGLTKSLFNAKKLYHKVAGSTILDYLMVEKFARAMPEDLKFNDTIDDVTAYQLYVNTKPWVWENYLRIPERRPSWITPPT